MNTRLAGAAAATLLALLGAAPAAPAQSFESGSNGSDGALSFAPDAGVVVFAPSSFTPPLDRDGDGVYHFTTITVPAGTTVRLRADMLGEGKPVVWLASGAVEIAGTIDLDGEPGHTTVQPARASIAGAGGFSGGAGGTAGSIGATGNGPGGGTGGKDSRGRRGGGAGHLVAGSTSGGASPGGPAYGNRYLFPLLGGSGGGGSSNETSAATGGGAGGGAILVASSISINLTGTISARGGGGGPIGIAGGGGDGSSGAIRLMTPTLLGDGTLDVRARSQLTSTGRVRIERFFDRSFTGSVQPPAAAVFSSPGSVFLPASGPRVRVTRVAGVDVAPSPTASFVTPDVTVDSAGPVTIDIEAANVPLGTVVRLRIVSEEGDVVAVDSAPPTGTVDRSTAAATATLPSGFSKIYLSADWSA